jgi:carbamoyltransferase
MTAILGISAFYHDSAAALVVDGRIVAAAQEERFTRKKHDDGFPQQAVDYCLQEAGLDPSQLKYVGFYDKPLRKFERLLETYVAFAPAGYMSFRKAMSVWLQQKLHTPRALRKGLHHKYSGPFVYTEHHEAHAASAFFPSPFTEAAILTMDGVGEWATTTMGVGRGNRIELTHEIRFPHSLGLLYSAFTYYTGFKVNSGEYKLMGLAPYGEPRFQDLILKHLLQLKDDGTFHMDMSYFNYCQGLTMTSRRFHDLFGGPPREPESEITQREMDLAASVQCVTEEIMLRMARHAHQQTGSSNLVLAGGVALNCVGNGRIQREGPFHNVWIQPASGDAGGALGVATFIWHQLMERPRVPGSPDGQAGSFLGPAFDDDAIEKFLQSAGAVFETYDSDDKLCNCVAGLLADEKIVGWFQGRMEFGPRALGARSILGDARSPKMQSVMNLKIKFRESFRPFAPIVLKEHAHNYFELPRNADSPYMLLVAPVQVECRNKDIAAEPAGTGFSKLEQIRSSIPAVTHVDYSARIQTIDDIRNPLTHRLLRAFQDRTGCPVLINTSFNVRSEPIVCSPEDAWRCFMATDMDVLVLGHHVLKKPDQPNKLTDAERATHLDKFTLD